MYSGEWIIFTGNQIGSILGAACFEKAIQAGKKPGKLIENKKKKEKLISIYLHYRGIGHGS